MHRPHSLTEIIVMKTVTVKRLRALCRVKSTAADGVRVLVDRQNVLGDDTRWDSSFRNYDYESSDGYAVMSLLFALEKHGVLTLKCDSDVLAHYSPKQPDIVKA